MLEIISEEFVSICKEYWDAVKLVLGFAAISCVFLLIGGEKLTYDGIGKNVVGIFNIVGILAFGFFCERVWKRYKAEKDSK